VIVAQPNGNSKPGEFTWMDRMNRMKNKKGDVGFQTSNPYPLSCKSCPSM
jgi:hypothetical protein